MANQLIEAAQQMANRLYGYRKIKCYSGAAENTAEDLAYTFPELDDDTINDLVFEASVYFQEKE